MTAERYAALANWAESAETVTMAAVAEGRFERAWPAAGAETPRPPVSHVAPGATRSRRIRAAVVTCAALALLAGGAAILWAGDDASDTPVTAGATPVGAEPAVSGTDVIDPQATADAPAASVSASPSASVKPSQSASPPPSPSGNRIGVGVDATTRTPARSAKPSAVSEEMPVYTAFYGYQADAASGYTGTVQVVNGGSGAGGDWAVTLTVPGGDEVALTSGNVRMSQSGSTVTFRPADGDDLEAGGSVTIGFAIDGVPEKLPTGCSINGTACA